MPYQAIRRGLVGSGAAAVLVGSFLPWLTSGDRTRSSYQLSVAVQRVGLTRNGLEHAVVVVWPLVPVVVLGAALLFWWRPGPLASIVLAVAALYVGAVSNLVWGSGLEARFGVPVTACGAALTIVGCLPLQVVRRRRVTSDAT